MNCWGVDFSPVDGLANGHRQVGGDIKARSRELGMGRHRYGENQIAGGPSVGALVAPALQADGLASLDPSRNGSFDPP